MIKEPDQYIDIYKGSDRVDQPHVVLELIKRDSSGKDDCISEVYRVVCSWLETQRKCDDFKQALYHALVQFSPSLEDWASSIIVSTLYKYKNLLHTSEEQDGILGSPNTIKTSKLLGEMLVLLQQEEEKVRGKQNPSERHGINKELIYVIGGREFKFGKVMAEWTISLFRKAISEQNYPLGLGIGMMELEEALRDGSIEQLLKMNHNEPIPLPIKNSQILTGLCLNLHKLVCGILNDDEANFTSKQLKLYNFVLQKFEVGGWENYQVNKKQGMDSFRMLLKRNMLRHS